MGLPQIQYHYPRGIKRLSLRVDHRTSSFKLSIPPLTPQFIINRFLKKNEKWIAEKSKDMRPKITIAHGTQILFNGELCDITISHHSKRKTDITIHEKTIQITTNRDDPTNNLKRWMIEQAREAITPLAHSKATRIQKTISKIDLRDPSSRWGSCSCSARLMFSWRLIMAPPDILDYVVAHEVAHLQHMDHSKAFWDLCYTLTDNNADNARKWMCDHGNTLMQWF